MVDFILHTNIFLMFALFVSAMLALSYFSCVIAMSFTYEPHKRDTWFHQVNNSFVSLMEAQIPEK